MSYLCSQYVLLGSVSAFVVMLRDKMSLFKLGKMKIDLVYLWVDGNDPEWQAKKQAFVEGKVYQYGEANHSARFFDNDELKYSLRSVCRYAPWINHIYIVSDNQVPEWLDQSNPKITVVDHTQILPPEALPTYSSPAIEWCLDQIPGLSEHFILANDDTFMGQEVTPDFFFTPEGYPVMRLKRRVVGHKTVVSLYMKTILRTQEIIYQRFGKRFKFIPHHNMDAYCLTDFKACKQEFSELVHDTVVRHFRSEEDFQRVAIYYYGLAIGHGKFRRMGRYNQQMPFFKRVWEALHGHYFYDARNIGITNSNIPRVFRKYNPKLFCLNDSENATPECRIRVRNLLRTMFPDKSPFEL